MNRQTTLQLVVNGLGVLVGLVLVWYLASSAFYTELEPPCRQRYPAAIQFALRDADGTLLSPMQLQAHAGLREWGVLENASVVAEGPSGAALQVKLASVKGLEASKTQRANGVDFRWSPSGIAQAGAVCLKYSVFLPEGFAFNDGGILPGVVGALPTVAAGAADNEGRFGSRLGWQDGGEGVLGVASSGEDYRPAPQQRAFALSPGRWSSVEQEIVLNTPGNADGIARLWIDGTLKAEDTGLSLRNDADAKFGGVLADIGYLRDPGTDSVLRLSAFELAWR